MLFLSGYDPLVIILYYPKNYIGVSRYIHTSQLLLDRPSRADQDQRLQVSPQKDMTVLMFGFSKAPCETTTRERAHGSQYAALNQEVKSRPER